MSTRLTPPRPAKPKPRSTASYWIRDRTQIKTLASTPRQDLLDRLAASGPLSVRELAAALGRRPSALYHHLQKLLATGLVEESGSRIVNRRTEKIYATPSPRMRLKRALSEPALRMHTPAVVAALCRQLHRDFARGAALPAAETEGSKRNLGFFRLVGQPSARGLARINTSLEEIAEILWRDHDARAPLVAFGWTLAPLRRAEDAQSKSRMKRRGAK